ncbi:MAG: hypothetical protein IPM11_00175 [Micropruina sp.]|nr:hypothetical protein [Micropruina sp.]
MTRRGSAPLVTHYDLATGARTELSAITFANWVDKTTNLLESLDVDPGTTIALPVLDERPGHWMGLIWPIAAWQRGCQVLVAPRTEVGEAALVVIGPGSSAPVAGLPTIACSLHPLGLSLRGLPPGVDDFTQLALAEPDACQSVQPDPRALAWSDADRRLTTRRSPLHPRSLAGACASVGPVDDLSLPPLAGPLLGGGSTVLVEGPADADELRADRRLRTGRAPGAAGSLR